MSGGKGRRIMRAFSRNLVHMPVPARAAIRMGLLALGLSSAAGCSLTTSLDGFAGGPAESSAVDGAAGADADAASDGAREQDAEAAAPANDAGFRVDHLRLITLD